MLTVSRRDEDIIRGYSNGCNSFIQKPVEFEKFVANPKKEIERIYNQFGFELTPEYQKFLEEETKLARNFTGGNTYSLSEMRLDKDKIIQDFIPVLKAYDLNLPLREEIAEEY